MFQPPRPLVAAAALPAFGRAVPVVPAEPFRLAVDLRAAPLSRDWWRGVATLGALLGLASLLAPSLDPLPAGPVEIPGGRDQWAQGEALSIDPLGQRSETGLRMSEGPRARPIAAAPSRVLREWTIVLSEGDELSALLRRNGASAGEAAQAAALAASAGASPRAGTSLALRLGSEGPGGRAIERLHYRARFDLDLTIERGGDGQLGVQRTPIALDRTPLRIRGVASGGLYWALRSAGASPELAASYLQTIGASLDVGSEVTDGDRFELVVAQARDPAGAVTSGGLLYAGLDRVAGRDLALVRFPVNGRLQWVDATAAPEPVEVGLARPVNAPVTSGFGMRVHPILRFARMHRGMDFGAPTGTPVMAAADGQVIGAGWAGGYGRKIKIDHGGGLQTSYSHLSRIVAPEGGTVRRGELIGYVGSSGLSTGPHLHYEVWKNGVAVNPATVTFTRRPAMDEALMAAVRARARALRGG